MFGINIHKSLSEHKDLSAGSSYISPEEFLSAALDGKLKKDGVTWQIMGYSPEVRKQMLKTLHKKLAELSGDITEEEFYKE